MIEGDERGGCFFSFVEVRSLCGLGLELGSNHFWWGCANAKTTTFTYMLQTLRVHCMGLQDLPSFEITMG